MYTGFAKLMKEKDNDVSPQLKKLKEIIKASMTSSILVSDLSEISDN